MDTDTIQAVQECLYVNEHGVKCGLQRGHDGYHGIVAQLVEPDPFCVRAHDPFALAVIRGWISAATVHKVPAAKILRAEEHFAEIKRWQSAHGTILPG
jgi:hypothetical protein